MSWPSDGELVPNQARYPPCRVPSAISAILTVLIKNDIDVLVGSLATLCGGSLMSVRRRFLLAVPAAALVLVATACGGSSGGGGSPGGAGTSTTAGGNPNVSGPVVPGHQTPQDAVDGLVQSELAGNLSQACGYVAPATQATCNSAASSGSAPPAVTGHADILGAVISGTEALVEVTGSVCTSGTCSSSSDPTLGMPHGSETFAQAYSKAQHGGGFSPVPCIEVNGSWYVNASG